MVRKWRQNDYFFGKFSSLGEVFGILQILVRSMRASINKWGVFGIFTLVKLRGVRNIIIFFVLRDVKIFPTLYVVYNYK